MKTQIVILFIWMSMVSVGAYGSSSLTLVKGEMRPVRVSFDIGDVKVSDRTVCEVKANWGSEAIYVLGESEGMATIRVFDTTGAERELVEVTVTMPKVEDTTHAVIDQAPSLPPVSIGAVAAELESAIAIDTVHVKAIRDKVVVEGDVYSSNDKRRVLELIKLYQVEWVDLVNLHEGFGGVGASNMIKLDVRFVEVKKNWLNHFGIRWSPGAFPKSSLSQGGGVVSEVGNVGGSLVGFVLNLLPKIDVARERDSAHVLESPSLIMKNGEKGRLFSGSQIPYYSNDQVLFKDVGISLDAQPVILNGAVDLNLTVSVSSLSAGTREGIDTHHIQTHVVCPIGESMALAGLVRNNMAITRNRIPSGVDTSTALWSLALSKEFQSGQSDMIIFVTPTIIDWRHGGSDVETMWSREEENIVQRRPKRDRRSYKTRNVKGEWKKEEAHDEPATPDFQPTLTLPSSLKTGG